MTRKGCRLLLLFVPVSSTAAAQDQPAWQWHADGVAFFGFNYQERKVRDFSAWESQNWLMAAAERQTERSGYRLGTMLSFEAFTLKDIGSPQVFQTGETFRNAPLVDYQHPHDLLMNLGGDYQHTAGRLRLLVGADVVGSPTLGPPPFMHRASANENPQAPLSHHYLDSWHVTPGVLRGGIGAGAWMVEGSRFHGREPDENRLDVDLGPLDSYAARLSWMRGPWSAQVSAAALTQPERLSPYDARAVTASVVRDGGLRGLSWTAAFGQKREVHGNFEAYLLEATLRTGGANTLYTRIEAVAKDILDAGFHPPGAHQHRSSQIGAFTAGYSRTLLRAAAGSIAAGGDVTAYYVAENLRESYGAPLSFHVFLRYRAPSRANVHVH